MKKPNRAFFGIVAFFIFVTALPLPVTREWRGRLTSRLEAPLSVTRELTQTVTDLLAFKKNADENRELRRKMGQVRAERFYYEELFQENERLTKLLNIRRTIPPAISRVITLRVIGKSPLAGNGVFLVDKGTDEGIKLNMLVLAEGSLIGKIIEAGPTVSKVLLISDPDFRIGALIQRTRQEGMIYGTTFGESRMKYISLELDLHEGDAVETAGFGGYYPKGLRIGTIERFWKEPGQIYQVAVIKPYADLSRVEEVVAIE